MEQKLTIGISSRALFDLDESHQVYETQGVEAYSAHQIASEEKPLTPGIAFDVVKKLLKINTQVEKPLVEILLLSRNTADTGLRVFNSLAHYDIDIKRAVFTGGKSPFEYISAFGVDLFLSANTEDVQQTLQAGFAAATLLPSQLKSTPAHPELRIAFDGDAVLFSDEAERIYQEYNLEKFVESEQQAAKIPLHSGPFKNFLSILHQIQHYFPDDQQPIRTALVTARSAPAHERVIRTLRSWGIRIDEALFLGGLPKGEFLRAFGADIFFDDQKKHCDSARQYVATGHVPHGIVNERIRRD
jgi:5'-nucleotidase